MNKFNNWYRWSGHAVSTAPDNRYWSTRIFTNALTPLFPYFPILLGFIAKYDKEKAKIGSVMAMVMPYTIAFGLVWLVQLAIWHLLNLPLGPGGGIYL